MKLRKHFIIFFILCFSFIVPASADSSARLSLGNNNFSINDKTYAEYKYQASESGIYTISIASSNSKNIDCYLSVKQQNSGYGFDNYTGAKIDFTIYMNKNDILYLNIFSQGEGSVTGNIKFSFLGAVKSFNITALPSKNEYVIGKDAFYYNNSYVIQNLDLTGAAAVINLHSGTKLTFKDEQLSQFIPAASYKFDKAGIYDLKPTCGSYMDTMKIVLRDAKGTEQAVDYACMIRGYYAYNKGSGIDFNSMMTNINADRIINTAFALACKAESHLNLKYYDIQTDTYVIPLSDINTYVCRYFNIPNINIEKTSFYNSSKQACVIPETVKRDSINTDMRAELEESLYGWIESDGSRVIIFPYVQENGTNNDYIKMEMTENQHGYCIRSVNTFTATDRIEIKSGYGIIIDNWNGYIEGINIKTDRSILSQALKNPSLCTIDASSQYVGTGNTIAIYKNGICINKLTAVIKGDITGDRLIRSADYLKIKAVFNGKQKLTGAYKAAADSSGDGKITTIDYLQIKKTFSTN